MVSTESIWLINAKKFVFENESLNDKNVSRATSIFLYKMNIKEYVFKTKKYIPISLETNNNTFVNHIYHIVNSCTNIILDKIYISLCMIHIYVAYINHLLHYYVLCLRYTIFIIATIPSNIYHHSYVIFDIMHLWLINILKFE